MEKFLIALRRVGKVFLGLILIILALLLFLILTIIALPFSLISPFFIKDHRNIGEILDGFSGYFISIAASLDQTGNKAFGKLLTFVLVNTKVEGHAVHEDIDDTISEVTGWNELNDSQTLTGRALSWVLNMLDRNHGIRSAASAYYKAEDKLERYKQYEDILIDYK